MAFFALKMMVFGLFGLYFKKITHDKKMYYCTFKKYYSLFGYLSAPKPNIILYMF
jgi:hypothetical protein